MGRHKKMEPKLFEEMQEMVTYDEKPEKEPKKVTSQQALKILSGNQRLYTYVGKKLKGQKTIDEWGKIFKQEKIY